MGLCFPVRKWASVFLARERNAAGPLQTSAAAASQLAVVCLLCLKKKRSVCFFHVDAMTRHAAEGALAWRDPVLPKPNTWEDSRAELQERHCVFSLLRMRRLHPVELHTLFLNINIFIDFNTDVYRRILDINILIYFNTDVYKRILV